MCKERESTITKGASKSEFLRLRIIERLRGMTSEHERETVWVRVRVGA